MSKPVNRQGVLVVGCIRNDHLVSNAPHAINYVGAGSGEGLRRAATYFSTLADGQSTLDELLKRLDADVDEARRALESYLAGFDSFDTLTFLRTLASPWSLQGVRESETLIETSQAAQDVVALALLGMGLPRLPLTGQNKGQPDPNELLRHGAAVVRAAQARALLRGQSVGQTLGKLAGEFLAYELSVRGRQYESIATELNDVILGDDRVVRVSQALLGFSLEDVRKVRATAVRLLNERLFRARDQVGEIAEAGERTEADLDAFRQGMNLMVNECRLYGCVTPTDVSGAAEVSEEVARRVLNFFSVGRSEDPVDLVKEFGRGSQLVPWGCLRDGEEHLLLNGFMSEDELRRDIERGLVAQSRQSAQSMRMWERYAKRRGVVVESITGEAIARLLNGVDPFWHGQEFVGPVRIDDTPLFGADAEFPTLAAARTYESDLLFVADGVALCVEVKSGALHDKSRAGNTKRLATDLQKTLTEGNEQAERLAALLRQNGGVWSKDRRWIDLGSVREIHSIIVMLDDMGPLSLSMNELARQEVIATAEVPWIVSLHDLLVVSRTFDHPAQFLQFLRRRRSRRLATMVHGADELDMVMWFLGGGMYFEQNPLEVAAQIPARPAPNEGAARRYSEQRRIQLGTLTDDLDACFYSLDENGPEPVAKPARREEPWMETFLSATETEKSPGWLRFGADLVGLSGKDQARIGRDLKTRCARAIGGRREESLTTHGTTTTGPWLLCAAAIPDGVSTAHLYDYIDGKQYQTRSDRSMLLHYGPDESLIGTRYRAEPEERTAWRDAEVAAMGLISLERTFGPRSAFSKPRPGARPNSDRAKRGRRR